jgi:hypothetical protein
MKVLDMDVGPHLGPPLGEVTRRREHPFGSGGSLLDNVNRWHRPILVRTPERCHGRLRLRPGPATTPSVWMRRANEASAEVQLIASEPVRTAAADLLSIHRELGDVLKVVLLGEARPAEEVNTRVDTLEAQEAETRRRFWLAARVELDVDTGPKLPRFLARFARRERAGADLLR